MLKGKRAHILLIGLLFTVMFIVLGESSVRGQRVYADTQISSPAQEINILLTTITLSEVQNPTNALGSSNITDYSTLFTTLGALSLIESWQNLRFPTQPPSNSPVTIKFGANTSVADVINGISIQPTLNGALVSSAYSSSTILGLLGSGTIDKEITLPAPGVAYNGVRYRVSPSLLGVAVTGRYYYAFYIAPPTINSVTICNGSTATLTISNPQSGYTYNWYNSSGALELSSTASTYTTPALTTSTAYTVEAVETASGTSYYSGKTSVSITINNPPTTASAGPDRGICLTTPLTLIGNTPTSGTGLWTRVSGPNTPTITSPSSASTTVTGLAIGTYVFRWTISNDPCTASTSDVTIIVAANVTASNAGTTQALCNVNSATLSGNNPTVGTGTWTRVSGPNTPIITNPNFYNTTVTGLIPGDYIFQWTIASASCASSTSTVNIKVSAPPTIANAGPNQLLCSATSTTLAGNSPTFGTGAWSWVSGPNTPVITTPAASNSTVTGMVAGTYVLRWTISNGGCVPSTSDVTIVVSTTPMITLGAGPIACEETTSATMIYTGTTGSPTTYSITWGNSALAAGLTDVLNVNLPSSPIILVVPSTAAVASYSGNITVKNAVGCESASVPFTFTLHPKPAAPHIITQ